ncbi:putative EamA domain, solute carrier family 35 member F3/F4 [Septoria linicola]|nr:putative EamA domain, solute carrier family 35 member F3/F4 [Septoria linicola]
MSRLAPNAVPRTKLEDTDDQDQPFLDSERRSQESDIELSELQDYQDGDDLAGERTPVGHYRVRSLDGPPLKKKVPAWKIALTLATCVLGFTINTEATAYIEDELGYKKPIATMYLTHSALTLPWIAHMLYLRYSNRNISYMQWVRDYNNQLRGSIATIDAFATHGSKMIIKGPGRTGGPLDFLATAMAIVTVVLTVSGFSWFTSLSLTTPADLTAIYNCSTFFAAAFSVPILKEKLGWISIVAVGLSIAGTFTIAYGDTTADHSSDAESEHSNIGASRLLGNIIACAGAVAFGLYEVLFKKWACSNRPETQESSLPLTLAASALTGFYTFGVLWVALIIFHILGIESFAIPTMYEWLWLVIAVLSGVIGITLLVILVIWTDPVFGSMANVLSVFFVALADWLVWGLSPSLATYIGGGLIFVAFVMLAYDTLGEKKQ